MPSAALRDWFAIRAAALDEIEAAHRSVGGSGPGRRTTTQQINQAYAVLLSSQFQGFCRDLHDEAAAFLVTRLVSAGARAIIRRSLFLNRKLDRGNPNAGNIGADFGRFDLPFWPQVEGHRPPNVARKLLLAELNEWRNAIAHQDFAGVVAGGGPSSLPLARVQNWRRACDGLARSFDEVIRSHLTAVAGVSPW